MAKKSKINSNNKKLETYLRYYDKVQELKERGRKGDQSAYIELQKLPRNASVTRHRNRDSIDGRPHGFIRKFGISRVNFRKMANNGELPGVKKASW